MIDLNPNHLEIVEQILAEHVPDCEVRAFGSRVNWTANDHSDLDLAVYGDSPLSLEALGNLKEVFEESNLPMRVDVLDWHSTSDTFKKIIENPIRADTDSKQHPVARHTHRSISRVAKDDHRRDSSTHLWTRASRSQTQPEWRCCSLWFERCRRFAQRGTDKRSYCDYRAQGKRRKSALFTCTMLADRHCLLY